MNKNTIIAVIVALVLIVGGYIFIKGQTNQKSSNNTSAVQNTQRAAQPTTGSEQNKNTTTVEYNGQGFNPKSITVKSGATVTWVNKDTDQLWVASNPHPTHTDYPGFDALKGIPTGETYSFTFTKVGKWGYHNHLEPDKTGEVVVEQ